MRGISALIALLLTSIFFCYGALASGGRTADGCTYKVINGQYLTDCSNKAKAEPQQDEVKVASAAPVTSYDSVPMRQPHTELAPALPPQQPNQARTYALEQSTFDAREESHDAFERHAPLLDRTYVGVLLGASNMKEANASSSTGLGLNLGTDIDEHFGVELGYTYASQNLNLGLASRSNGGADTGAYGPAANHDSELASHLFTAEVQAFLTEPAKRLRPFVGAGLGWRSSTLSEVAAPSAYGSGSTGPSGSLHQNVFGGLLDGGTKLRISKTLNLAFDFRYFFPLSRSSSRLEEPTYSYPGAPGATDLTHDDEILTGSAQYQILGGLQYSF